MTMVNIKLLSAAVACNLNTVESFQPQSDYIKYLSIIGLTKTDWFARGRKIGRPSYDFIIINELVKLCGGSELPRDEVFLGGGTEPKISYGYHFDLEKDYPGVDLIAKKILMSQKSYENREEMLNKINVMHNMVIRSHQSRCNKSIDLAIERAISTGKSVLFVSESGIKNVK
ncbi:hypothetical protein VPAG_00040 [Vibrio phage douglas 12A4]|uniref:hypothetical protein n=1 Tax=Vibrio phage douglas 12A4 TaxID=573171 RepID=UPI0002C041A2|nr:hypothetical protein VPAG_00040 [Vibrio phage douglas 12A4]AGG58076.1 hypothetical protein VPAG_00040 [Vibrio phage douglas 12A4]